jgi:hypothetical protein
MRNRGQTTRTRQGKLVPTSAKPAIVSITFGGASPQNFQPSATFNLLAITEPRDANDVIHTNRIVSFSTNNAAIADVGVASGVVTAQSVGTCVITVRCEATATTFTIVVTSPQSSVHHVNVVPASSSLFVGSTVGLTADPEDVNNNDLPGLGATWRSTNTAVATVVTTGNLTATASAVSVGSANIIATVSNVDSANVPLTISAATGFTDALGINHPNMPSNFTPLLGNFYLSRSKTILGAESTLYQPYWLGGSEGRNTAMEQFIAPDDVAGVNSAPVSGVTDNTRPFQSAIQTLVGNSSKNNWVAWFRVAAGQLVNSGWQWGRAFTQGFHPTSSYYRTALRKKWRSWYSHTVIKYRTDYESWGPSGKMEFFDGALQATPTSSGIATNTINSPQPLWQPRHSDSRSTTNQLNPWSLNLQGSVDNDLGGSSGTTVNGVFWKSGAANFSYPMTRGIWYSIEVLVTCATTVGTGAAQRDGRFAIWIAPYDDQTMTFGVPTTAIDATGLEIHGSAVTSTMGRSCIVSHQRHFQVAASSSPYTGVDSGAYVALDFFAGGGEF